MVAIELFFNSEHLFVDIWSVTVKMTVLAKRELIYLGGTFGIGSLLAGMTFINRSAGGKAGEAMNAAMMELKNNNEKLWIFPEGTRRNTGEIHEFKKGAFHAAICAQVPIIPVVYGSYKFMFDSDKSLFKSGNINIVVLPEISTLGLTDKDVDTLMKKTKDIMINAYNNIADENSSKIE